MRRINCVTVLFLGIFILIFSGTIFAQEVGEILWEDHFEDTETDSAMHKDVGWFYYDEADGLAGAIVKQTEDNVALLQTGNFSSLVGAVVTQTNGVPFLDPEDEDATHDALVLNNYSHPNQEITFSINFKKIESSFFTVAARLVQRDTSESLPDSDPTEEGAYVLFISPLTNDITISRVLGVLEGGAQYDFLNPNNWTHFAATQDFEIEQNVNYWIKFYLYENNFKMKIWEGELDDEEEDWLLEATEDVDTVRVSGKFTQFGMISQFPTATDRVEIDDVVVRLIEGAGAIDDDNEFMPGEFKLSNNYPNPFNPSTTIAFNLDKAGHTTISIYSVNGQLQRTVVSKQMTAGSHVVTFDGRDDVGNMLASGVYFYKLQSGQKITTKKMVLIK
jgi:hypothetical protein